MCDVLFKARSIFACLFMSLVIVVCAVCRADGIPEDSGRTRILAAKADASQSPTTTKPTPAIDPQVRAVLDKLAAAGIARPSTVADVRKAYLFYPKLSGTPEHVFRIDDRHIPGPAGEIPIRVYTPVPTSPLPVVVFFHGGGFVAGSLDSHDIPLRALSNKCDCIVVSVAYRLAPENEYPAAPEDAYAATKWVADHAVSVGGDPHRIAVAGDGTGGNLAAVVTLMARKRGTPPLVFQLLIYPMLDDSTMRPSWWAETDAPAPTRELKNDILATYLPAGSDLNDPFVGPLHAKDFKNLPPALLVSYGEDDPMRIEVDEYARRLVEDGVDAKVSIYPKALHGFFLFGGELDAAKKCIDEAAGTLKNTFNRSARALP